MKKMGKKKKKKKKKELRETTESKLNRNPAEREKKGSKADLHSPIAMHL